MLRLGLQDVGDGVGREISVILNKRSRDVLQGGDLCCPGGTINSRLDAYLAKALSLPGSPLSRWPYWALLTAVPRMGDLAGEAGFRGLKSADDSVAYLN